MDREKILVDLNAIFREVLDNNDIVLNDATTADDIEEWDSFEQINLVIAIEDFYHEKLSVKDINQLGNIGEMISYLQDNIE